MTIRPCVIAVAGASLAAVLGSAPCLAPDAGLRATEVEVCREIVQRRCQGLDRAFPAGVQNVYFMTRIEGATGEAFVTHVWYFEREEVRRTSLPVKGTSYRTWSLKTVKGLPGKWKVEVLDPVGRSLGAVDFLVSAPDAGDGAGTR